MFHWTNVVYNNYCIFLTYKCNYIKTISKLIVISYKLFVVFLETENFYFVIISNDIMMFTTEQCLAFIFLPTSTFWKLKIINFLNDIITNNKYYSSQKNVCKLILHWLIKLHYTRREFRNIGFHILFAVDVIWQVTIIPTLLLMTKLIFRGGHLRINRLLILIYNYIELCIID